MAIEYEVQFFDGIFECGDSIGCVQSNHTRMVAATAAKIGMKCVVIQESWVPHEDAVYDRVGQYHDDSSDGC